MAVLLLTSAASSASAQNYSLDARRIALGGAGGTPNVASKLVERQRPYKSILIPVGLVKMLSDVRVFYPNRPGAGPDRTAFLLNWNTSSKGIGLSMDFGVAFVVNR